MEYSTIGVIYQNPLILGISKNQETANTTLTKKERRQKAEGKLAQHLALGTFWNPLEINNKIFLLNHKTTEHSQQFYKG